VILPVISQARHRIHPSQPDGWWPLATQLPGDRVESFVQGSSALLCERSVQLLALRLQRLVQLLALLGKRLFGVPAGCETAEMLCKQGADHGEGARNDRRDDQEVHNRNLIQLDVLGGRQVHRTSPQSANPSHPNMTCYQFRR
jgi:hypothetical protein